MEVSLRMTQQRAGRLARALHELFLAQKNSAGRHGLLSLCIILSPLWPKTPYSNLDNAVGLWILWRSLRNCLCFMVKIYYYCMSYYGEYSIITI